MDRYVLSLFSSAGIGELGIKASGLKILLSNELVESRCALYRENYPETECLCGDIWQMKDRIIQNWDGYKAFHNVDHFDNDWYEFVEYGTTNDLTIFLQRVGFTRDSATFLEQPRNRTKYIAMVNGEIRVKKSAWTCGNASVEIDSNEIKFNMPELFID